MAVDGGPGAGRSTGAGLRPRTLPPASRGPQSCPPTGAGAARAERREAGFHCGTGRRVPRSHARACDRTGHGRTAARGDARGEGRGRPRAHRDGPMAEGTENAVGTDPRPIYPLWPSLLETAPSIRALRIGTKSM